MSGLLDRAKNRATPAEKQQSDATVFTLERDDPLNAAIGELHQLDDQERKTAAKIKAHKEALRDYADSQFINLCALRGTYVKGPFQIRGSDGGIVSYVVQDRTGSTALTPKQLEHLETLLGERAKHLTEQKTTYSLNQRILELPGVAAVVERSLQKAVEDLVGKHGLSRDQAEDLIVADTRTVLRSDVLGGIWDAVGNRKTRLSTFLSIVGAAVTRFIKL